MGSYTPAIRRIGIIGAGPVGVAFAKHMLAENAFDRIEIWEQRDRVGGIWNLSPPDRSKRIPIPQTDPRYGQKARVNSGGGNALDDSLEFESPLYDYLETNIPKELMAYAEKPFAADDPLFPPHDRVLEYLEEYSNDVKQLITFNHQVQDLKLDETSAPGQDVWRMETVSLQTRQISVHHYDAVVVANGHYTVPSVPEIDGLEAWNKDYPGAVIHSKAYRKPEEYTGKKVLVIGNAASGLDIAYQVSEYSQQPVVLSSRSASIFATGKPPPWRKDVLQSVEFLPSSSYDRAVKFEDGHIEEGIDQVIFCTGYYYSIPFVRDFKPLLITDGLRIQDVYRDLFYIHHPSLVLPVINLRVIPFPLAENQAAVVARIWSGRLSLPSQEDMRKWEKDKIASNGNGKHFHLKKFPEDCAQINELHRWALAACTDHRLENDGQGKLGRGYDEKAVWLRSQFPAVKAAYLSKGKDRRKIKRVEDLGFDFVRRDEDREMYAAAEC